jgi:O-antigen ligase
MTANPDSPLVRLMAPAWLIACLVLGGSSSGGVLVNGLLQIGAGAIIVWMIQRGIGPELDRSARLLLALMTAAVLLALLTLVPLPPALWKLLGGRGAVFDAYALIGMPAPWLPVSLAPDATIAALFSFLPPVAMFLLIRACPPSTRRAAVITLAVAAFASVLFGVVQQVGGFRSDTYLYQYTSRGGAVGFFANRNHLATLCLMTMPFLAALAAMARRKGHGAQPGGWMPMAGALLLLVVGTLAVQSLAGWILLPPTLLACVLVFQRPRQGRWLRALAFGLMVVAAVAVLAALFAPWSPADLDRLGGEVQPQERRAIMGLTWQAAQHFWPFGAGWGSFAEIYRRFEDPAAITGTFVNHAHNDYLEVLLEAGMFGVALVLAFLVWWAAAMREAWRTGGDPIARAATVSIGVVVAHSFVDYPVRTAAIACVAALCCGLAGVRAAAAEPRRRNHERTAGTILLGAAARAGRPTRAPVAPQ